MSREVHVRFCERLGGRFLGSTRPMCESFFATLECELIDRCVWRTQAEARMAIFEFIEGWYNPHRRHSRLGYHRPMDYERQTTQLQASVQ